MRGKVDELRESADSAGGQLREIRESLLKNGATMGQVKMVRELTLTPSEYEGTKKTMVSNGFTEKQAAEVAQEAKLVALVIIAAQAGMWLGGKIFKAGKNAIDGFLKCPLS